MDMSKASYDLRECRVNAIDLRQSITAGPPEFFKDQLVAIVLQGIYVPEGVRRRGLCKEVIQQLCDDDRYELVIVEGVQNSHLADALTRWGWPCGRGVMDFYWPKSDRAKGAVAAHVGRHATCPAG